MEEKMNKAQAETIQDKEYENVIPGGLPVALMEAMACGLPAVCTDIRGNTELVEDGVTGLIVANTPEDTKRAIEILQDKAAFRDELSVHALNKIKQFDLSHVLPIMQNIYGGEL